MTQELRCVQAGQSPAEGIPPDDARRLRWPHRLGIKMGVVKAGW